MKNLIKLLCLSIMFMSIQTFAQMPPNPELLKKIKKGEITKPYFLHNIEKVRKMNVEAPWTSKELKILKSSPQLNGFKRSFGPSQTPSGNYNALVILAKFSDKPSQVSASFFDTLLFVQQNGTLTDYYEKISYSTLHITTVTVNLPSSMKWNMAPQPYNYYVNGMNGFGSYPQNSQKLVEDMVNIVDPIVDFSKYDNNGDGYVDALFIVHTGPGAEWTGSSDDIWSHSWQTYNTPNLDGVSISQYSMEPEYWMNPGDMTVGVYAHEMGHAAFGLPDLYDYDGSSMGLGMWSLMASGSWNGINGMGETPSTPDAFCLIQMGFVTPTIIADNTTSVSIANSEDNKSIYMLSANGTPSPKYFLVQNRQLSGYDSFLPGDGINIFHVDETVTTGNDNEWYPGHVNNGHYLVAMEQADGLWELERNASAGNNGDSYPGKTVNLNFTPSTTPGSYDYNFDNTFCAVKNISASSPLMTADFEIKTTNTLPAPTHLKGSPGNNKVDLAWDAPLPPGNMVLGYDDGTAESFWYFSTASGNEFFAVAFTHNNQFTLNSGLYYLQNPNSTDLTATFYVVGDAGGKPDLNNILTRASKTISANTTDWYNVEFQPITLPANSVFYLLCQWNNGEYYYVGGDESSPNGMSFFTGDYGANWTSFTSADFMIRAVITSTTTSPFVLAPTLKPLKGNVDSKQISLLANNRKVKTVQSVQNYSNILVYNNLAYKTFTNNSKLAVKTDKASLLTKINLSPSFDHFNIYRSLNTGNNYTLIGTTANSNFEDNTAANGTKYFYVVSAIYTSPAGESDYSNEVFVTPFDPTYKDINSPYSTNIPVIDGIFNVNEWSDAWVKDINVGGISPVKLYVKNSGTMLYMAVLDFNHMLSNIDQIGIYFDRDHNKMWDEYSPSSEGNFWVMWDSTNNQTMLEFRGIYGNPPNFETPILNPTGLEGQIGSNAASIVYETAIDLRNSKMQELPGNTLGIYIFSYDAVGNAMTGAFPENLGSNFANPALYGNLTLGTDKNAPIISVNPTVISQTVSTDTTITDSFTIANIGNGTLTFDLQDMMAVAKKLSNEKLNVSISQTKGDGKKDFINFLKYNASLKSSAVPWLNESPLTGSLNPGDTVIVTVTMNSTGLSVGTYSAYIIINSNDPINPTEYVSVNLIRGAMNVTTDDNENNQHTGIPDYDMDVYLFNDSPIVPIEFNIFINETSINTAQLNIMAWDVDWASGNGYMGERDKVFFNGHDIGYLTGANNEWSTSIFQIDPSWVNKGPNGKNLVQVYIDEYNEGWATQVDWGQLIINGSKGSANFRYVNLDKSIYLAGETVAVSEEVDANPSMMVKVETNLIDQNFQIYTGTNRTFEATSGNEPFIEYLAIPNSLPIGDYKIQAVVYDANTLIQQDIKYVDFKVSDQSLQTGQTIFTGFVSIDADYAPSGTVIYTFLKKTNTLIQTDTVRPFNQGKNYSISILEGNGGVADNDTLVFYVIDKNGIWLDSRYCPVCNAPTFSAMFPPAIKEYNIKLAHYRFLSIPLVQGYNAISWNIKPSIDSVNFVFKELIMNNKIQIILDYENDGINRPYFNYYIPELTYYNPMQVTDFTKGYFVKLRPTQNTEYLNMGGISVRNEIPIPLKVGYNMVSYLPERTSNIPFALQSINPNNIFTVLNYVNLGTGQPGDEYFEAYPQSNNFDLTENKGYFVRIVNSSETLIYPDIFANLTSTHPMNNENKGNKTLLSQTSEMPLSIFAYGTKVTFNGKLVPANSVLTAIDKNGIICGEGKFAADGVVSIAIAGDNPSTKQDEGADIGENVSLYLNKQLLPSKVQWKEFGDTPILEKLDAVTGVEYTVEKPKSFALYNNYPNPFNPSTSIKYDLVKRVNVSLVIYDINGRVVKNLVNSEQSAGYYNITWDGTNIDGNTVSTGIYFLKLVAGDFVKMQKLLLLK